MSVALPALGGEDGGAHRFGVLQVVKCIWNIKVNVKG